MTVNHCILVIPPGDVVEDAFGRLGLFSDGISCWDEWVDGIPPDPPLSVTEFVSLSITVTDKGL